MVNDFLPKGYQTPKTSGNYLKLKKGTNTIRVLGPAITGWEYWTKENKPVRSKKEWTSLPVDAKLDKNGNFQKHFWAFPVWNYDENKVQVMEITQSTIMQAMEALVKNPKWGSPVNYDLSITAEGDGLERTYSVVPEPPSPAPKADISDIYLERLFEGGDPFSKTMSDGTPMPDFTPKDIDPFGDFSPV